MVHGRFPPAYVTNEKGDPSHSWRVLILPYLGKKELYDAYDFHFSWNSGENQEFATEIAEAFQCPSDPGQRSASRHTNYIAVVGPGTVWGQERSSLTADSLKDSIMVVEYAGDDLNVLEPRDLHVSELQWGINHSEHQGVSSNHPGGALVGHADGHVTFIENDSDPNASVKKATLTDK